MNLYTTPDALRSLLAVTSTVASDAVLLLLIAGVSRAVDRKCHRHFYTKEDTLVHMAETHRHLFIDDLLRMDSISAAGSVGGTLTLLDSGNVVLHPLRSYPKVQLMGQPLNHSFLIGIEVIYITGLWGYGDGDSASPFSVSQETIDDIAVDATSFEVSSVVPYAVGQTLLLTTGETTEQVYVSGLDTGSLTLTIKRGVNGTSAAVHAACTVQIAEYPADLVSVVNASASRHFNAAAKAGIKSEKLDQYSVTFADVVSSTDAGTGGGIILNKTEISTLGGSGFIRRRF